MVNFLFFCSCLHMLKARHRMEVPNIKLFSLCVIVHSVHMPNKYTVINLYCFIHCGMVERTIQIWNDCNLVHFILWGMVDHTNLAWNVSTQSQILLHYKAHIWSLLWLFVHELLYQIPLLLLFFMHGPPHFQVGVKLVQSSSPQ